MTNLPRPLAGAEIIIKQYGWVGQNKTHNILYTYFSLICLPRTGGICYSPPHIAPSIQGVRGKIVKGDVLKELLPRGDLLLRACPYTRKVANLGWSGGRMASQGLNMVYKLCLYSLSPPFPFVNFPLFSHRVHRSTRNTSILFYMYWGVSFYSLLLEPALVWECASFGGGILLVSVVYGGNFVHFIRPW